MAQFNTEHDHGDLVWYLNSHFKAVQGRVSQVQVTTQDLTPSGNSETGFNPRIAVLIQYLIEGRYFGEDRVFKTKVELIEHITNES